MRAILAAILGVCAAFAASPSEVVVKVTGARSENGRVVVSIYESKSGFLKNFDQAVRTVSVPVVNGAASAVFTNLPSRSYAVAVVHDENANGRFDPSKEGFGVSSGDKAGAGQTFDDAKFQVNGTPKQVEIQLSYK